MRTGIAVFELPITVMSVLIATSKYYDIVQVMHLLVPLLILCAALVRILQPLGFTRIYRMFTE